ncbi:hypothetical protein UFOVP964_104 [uncultured Caudovirales phage]|uniref:Uncharacterized protein n=1 Tax=uncultured Caudovirales phage TaxID=2100421 RepID=A0A6J5R6S4_9CAUD|nr:hypothetical protein UFOVP854_104 [uncultured Caudovirales phage]CAB4174969.1 hypothetical protein UFOVP964_104 [uncultured Caudovirales phage]CAB4179274.1 hypothetical protein UFOVP1034_54 [uncultured Caudovirales phage]CAB4189098.1 hypothetical protein UFOVP1177_54 [uncultured Caudovirales phage]CAB4193220.1 hypothetical protein UFOVP1243_41 [uncultured Caudovirales phage]
MRLTRRGKIVVALILIAIFFWLMDITTPNECKVPLDSMTQWCKDFRYP